VLKLAAGDGKLGPGLRRTDRDCDAILAAARNGAPPASSSRVLCGNRWKAGQIEVGGMTFDGIAAMMWPIVGRIVVNGTGLQGRFDFELDYSPDSATNAMGDQIPVAPANPNAPSLFTAVQEQLGLRLESQRALRNVLVIDRVERPTPD
jgi:uncharacterized protein (TIGR03435 family)